MIWAKILKWLKEQWKGIALAVAAVIAIGIVGKKSIAVLKRIFELRRWKPDPKDPTMIMIKDGGEYVPVKLPPGVTSDKVVGAGLSESKEWAVEVLHESVDRHGDPDVDRGSGLGIG